jgi:hypothetical protein
MDLESSDLFLELIDPFLERAQGEFSNMLAGRWALLGSRVEFLQLLELPPGVFQLASILNGHGTISTMPLGTMFRSVAKVRSVNCWKATASTNSLLMNGSPARSSASAAAL